MFTQIANAAEKAVSEEVRTGLGEKISGFFGFLIDRLPSWIAGFVIFVLTIFVAKIAKSAVESRISGRIDEEHQEVLVLAGRVTYFATFTLGITIALKIAGIDLTTILAAVAFGIGFALKDLIMNFIAGVFILLSRQFTIGDFIKVGETVGKVMEIQTRATILKAIDGTKVIVPNAEIFKKQVTSFTTNPTRRVIVPLYVSYDTDLTYAMKVALEILKKHAKILKKPSPSLIVKDYGDSEIELTARFWVGSRDGWYKIRSEIMHAMWDAFQNAGIVVPYNIMHLETNQDTQQEWKKAQEITQKKQEEMKLSEGIATDAQNLATQTTNGSSGLAPATVPVEPTGAYTDQEEIDGQA